MLDERDRVAEQIELLAKLETAAREMREILEPARSGDATKSERLLTQAVVERLDSLASRVTDLNRWREVRDEVEVRAAQTRMQFNEWLERALTSAGITWSGEFPEYRLGSARLARLVVDPQKGTVKLGRRTWPIGDADAIVRELLLIRATRRAAAMAEPPVDFGKQLEEAYARAADAAGVRHGEYVSIGKVYDALRGRMPRGYSRERFAVDLAHATSTSDRVEFAASRHPRHGIRVPPGDGTLVGSLRLRMT